MWSDIKSARCTINYKPFLGLFYSGITSFFFTLASVFVKKLMYISAGQLSMIRNVGLWTGGLPIAIYIENSILVAKEDRRILFARSLVVATAFYFHVAAFQYLPLAEAAIILSSVPTVTTAIARVYLKEPCGIFQSFALITTLGGVLLSVRLPEIGNKSTNSEVDSNYVFGLASAVVCVLLYSVGIIMLRKTGNIHFSANVLFTGFVGMIGNGIINVASSHFAVPRCGWDQMFVILIGILSFVGQCTFTLSNQMEAAGITTTMKASMDIIFALVFQIIFFKEHPDIYNVSGAILVIVSVSIIGFKKWVVSLPEESETKKRFKLILL